MKIAVIYHRADFDGIFCREIARKFLPEAQLIFGWDFADAPIPLDSMAEYDRIYILDLPIDRVFGYNFKTPAAVSDAHHVFENVFQKIIWIDHHKSAIETHPTLVPGLRIDGVSACRLAWHWFQQHKEFFHPTGGSFAVPLSAKEDFIERRVIEPLAVRLAGEYDVWDKRDSRVDVFQLGLRGRDLTPEDWKWLLTVRDPQHQGELELASTNLIVDELCERGWIIQKFVDRANAETIRDSGFIFKFEGLNFLALNTTAKGSMQFAAHDTPDGGHDALLKFHWDGKQWDVSMYHAKHRTDIDLSVIAAKHGGGGHRGACGFRTNKLPFIS